MTDESTGQEIHTLSIRARALDLQGKDEAKSDGFYADLDACIPVEIELFVNELRLGQAGYVDVCVPAVSLSRDINGGKVFLFICGCGFPGCTALDEWIDVAYRGDFAVWSFRPMAADWFRTSTFTNAGTQMFRRADLRQQFQSMRTELERLCGGDFRRIRVPIHDEPLGDLEQECPGLARDSLHE